MAAPSVVQTSSSGSGGDWLGNPQTLPFGSNLAGNNTLLAVGCGTNIGNVTPINDTQANTWVNLSLGNNQYGISYTLDSSAGSDTVNYYGATPGINTYNPCMMALEINGVVGFGEIVSYTGSNSQASGSISLPQGEFSFTSSSTYPTQWYLDMVYLTGHTGTGIVFAVIDVPYGAFALDTVPGWTRVAHNLLSGIYSVTALPVPPATVRMFVNTGPTIPISSF